MKKNLLLAATAIIALTGVNGMAAPSKPAFDAPKASQSAWPVVSHSPGKQVLYTQNSNPNGIDVNSQNYTSGNTANNDQGADDFIVPSGKTWKVTEVDVTGYGSFTTSVTENVTFYKDKDGVPGKLVRNGSFLDLSGTGNPNFAMSLGKGVRLKAGHYWVSVVANCSFKGGCAWGWGETSTFHNDAAVWQNPGNGSGLGCTTWMTVGTCTSYAGDFMFALQGKSQ